mgnify:CR=1 FL=1
MPNILIPENADCFVQGPHVALWRWQRSNDQGELAYHLWQTMRAEDVHLRYFHEEFVGAHGHLRGDLACFITHYLLPPDRANLIITAKDSGIIYGVIDFHVFASQRYAMFGVWTTKAGRKHAQEAGKLATSWAFCVLPVDTLFGFSPHKYVQEYGIRGGWTSLGHIPRFFVDATSGEKKPMYGVTVTREDWELTHAKDETFSPMKGM